MKPNKRTTVATLQATGTSQREIARVAGVDRKRFAAWRRTRPGRNQIPPPWRPAIDSGPLSLCEPHRAFIGAQLRLRRNYTSIYQDLV